MTQLHDRYRAALDAGDRSAAAGSDVCLRLPVHPSVRRRERTHGAPAVAPAAVPAGYRVGRYHCRWRRRSKRRRRVLRFPLRVVTGLDEAHHSLVPWWEYFVGVMLVKAYRVVRRARRRHERATRRKARHDSGRGDPVPEAISLRRPRASAAGHQQADDRAGSPRTSCRGRDTMREAGT